MPPVLLAFTLWDNVDISSLNGVITLIGNLIKLALFFAGVLAIIFIIIGGIQYMTSAGNPSGTAKAKSTITHAVIGLVIALGAFAIVNFIIDSFVH